MEQLGEGEWKHETKPSVLKKKVKDKAKIVKDTIKRYTPGRHHNHADDDERSMINNHHHVGAPMIESTVIRSRTLPKEAADDDNTKLQPKDDRDGHKVRDGGLNARGKSNPHSGPAACVPENPKCSPKNSDPEEAPNEGVSVKEYLADKLRPGDADKALAKEITEAFHKKTE